MAGHYLMDKGVLLRCLHHVHAVAAQLPHKLEDVDCARACSQEQTNTKKRKKGKKQKKKREKDKLIRHGSRKRVMNFEMV